MNLLHMFRSTFDISALASPLFVVHRTNTTLSLNLITNASQETVAVLASLRTDIPVPIIKIIFYL